MKNKNWAELFITKYEKEKLNKCERYRNDNYIRNTMKKEV
jgi:hypothetical protein